MNPLTTTVSKSITELKPAEYNPRRLSTKQCKDLKASLTKYGCVEPVIVNINKDRMNVIVGGHQRLKIWQQMGNNSIDCIEVDLSLEDERELNVRLNKNTGEFDFDILANWFDVEDLVEWGFEEFELGMGNEEVQEVKDLSENITDRFIIEIDCKTEAEQEELFNRLTKEGLTCKILTL